MTCRMRDWHVTGDMASAESKFPFIAKDKLLLDLACMFITPFGANKVCDLLPLCQS